MEALLVEKLPEGSGWQYEPKWDGFRCLAFRAGDSVELQSKSGQSLTRYFPEVVATLLSLRAGRFALDGEIVIPVDGQFSFDDLLQRIHPAESRVKKLSVERPALLVVFDLLVDTTGNALVDRPLRERRRLLEALAKKEMAGVKGLRLSPAATDLKTARMWLDMSGSSFDGVVAKRLDLEYRGGDRTGMQKVKPVRTADCVVGGFRYASAGRAIGSLLLGLYDAEGLLHHVGFTSGFQAAERKSLLLKLEPLIKPPGFTGQAPGGPSRWSTERSAEWQPLSPKLVVEVRYDHVTGDRFRHGTRLLRWRPDKKPSQCTIDQIRLSRPAVLTGDGRLLAAAGLGARPIPRTKARRKAPGGPPSAEASRS